MFNPYYNQAVLYTKLIKSEDGLIPELPFPTTMRLVFANGRNFYSDQITDERLEGIPCICFVTYAIMYDEIVKEFYGFLGRGYDATHTDAFKLVVPMSEDGTQIWIFLEEGYEDK